MDKHNQRNEMLFDVEEEIQKEFVGCIAVVGLLVVGIVLIIGIILS